MGKKRIVAVCVAVLMMVGGVVWAGIAIWQPSPYAGEGASVQISSVEHFERFMGFEYGSNARGHLTSDLTLPAGWTGAAQVFRGTLDGGGFTIYAQGTWSAPLFDAIDGGIVRNLTVANAEVNGGAGILASEIRNGTVVSRVHITNGRVVSGGRFVGGMAGRVLGSTIELSSANVQVVAEDLNSDASVGALAGATEGDVNVVNTYTTGTVRVVGRDVPHGSVATASKRFMASGLVGEVVSGTLGVDKVYVDVATSVFAERNFVTEFIDVPPYVVSTPILLTVTPILTATGFGATSSPQGSINVRDSAFRGGAQIDGGVISEAGAILVQSAGRGTMDNVRVSTGAVIHGQAHLESGAWIAPTQGLTSVAPAAFMNQEFFEVQLGWRFNTGDEWEWYPGRYPEQSRPVHRSA